MMFCGPADGGDLLLFNFLTAMVEMGAVKKTEIMTVGIGRADHATPPLSAKVSTNLLRMAVTRSV
jgi:hypothetical protein